MLLVGSSLPVFLQCFVGHGPHRTPNASRPQWTSTKCFLYEFLFVAKVAIIWIYVSECRAMVGAIGPEWINSHQCTSWPLCPLDGLCFFIWCRIRFIRIHFFLLLITVLLFFFGFWTLFPGLDLTHSLLTFFSTLINIAPTLVLYLLSLTDISTLITSYTINLVTILTIYLTNLITLLITYPINLTIVLTIYPIDLATLDTQLPYWHKYFTNLVILIR